MRNRNKLVLICIFLFLTKFQAEIIAKEKTIRVSSSYLVEQKVKLSWEEVDSAISYIVKVADTSGKLLIRKEVCINHIELELLPGNYQILIGSVNKFGRVGSWSDWAHITIKKPEPKKEKVKEIVKPDLFNLGLKFGFGVSYFYILPDWNEYYNNSYNAYSMNIAYSLRHIGFSGFFSFLKYTGIDLECIYVQFSGKKAFNRVESDITDIISGAKFFISTNFQSPINFAVKGGAGLSNTTQEYQKYDDMGDPADKGVSKTNDLSYNGGVSMEYRFYSSFFLEISADYYAITYLIKEFRSARFSCQVGIRL